ncbi:unnamed protein product [Penicillium nalgiovense]|nr:unnamed protein product [Penicillium nalgiovense]
MADLSMNSDQANIAAALFADSEAAFVLCNEYAMAQDEQVTPQFELLEWGCDLVPGTAEHMTFYAGIDGSSIVICSFMTFKKTRLIIRADFRLHVYIVYRATLSRDIPKYTKHAIGPMFERLLPLYEDQVKCQPRLEGQLLRPLGIHDFDWALHPGGRAIIDGVAEDLQLSKDQLQASREMYRTSGNSSSASVLIVLVRLRLESKKAHIAATSFGPGLAIEMALLRMCQVDE